MTDQHVPGSQVPAVAEEQRAEPLHVALTEQPVFLSDPWQGYVVTQYDLVLDIIKQAGVYSSREALHSFAVPSPVVQDMLESRPLELVVNSDGQAHRRLRHLLDVTLAPRMKTPWMRTTLQRIVDTLLEKFVHDGRADLFSQFGSPLAIEVIIALLGVPESKQDEFRLWSRDVPPFVYSLVSLSPTLEETAQVSMAQSLTAMQDYFFDLLAEKRRNPGDDLVTDMLAVPTEHALSELELVNTLTDVVLGVYLTTPLLVANCAYLFLHKAEFWRSLQGNKQALENAVEEVLRFGSPLQMIFRVTTRETTLPGISTPIPPGSLLILHLGAANRSPAHFALAGEFGPEHASTHHLTFGHGRHFCVGAPLARLEAEVAFETLTRILPDAYLVAAQQYELFPNPVFLGFSQLEVAWPKETVMASYPFDGM